MGSQAHLGNVVVLGLGRTGEAVARFVTAYPGGKA